MGERSGWGAAPIHLAWCSWGRATFWEAGARLAAPRTPQRARLLPFPPPPLLCILRRESPPWRRPPPRVYPPPRGARAAREEAIHETTALAAAGGPGGRAGPAPLAPRRGARPADPSVRLRGARARLGPGRLGRPL